MFKVTKKNPNRLDIELSGKMNSEEMQIALDELDSMSEDIVNGAMLYDIVEFNMPSLNAIAIEISRLPSLLRLTRKFNKVAILSDKNWIQKFTELEGLLIPGMDIKAFGRDQKKMAESWLIE